MSELKVAVMTGTGQYSILAKTFHWGGVALFAYGIFKQVEGDVGQLEDKSLLYLEVVFASLFLAVLAVRFIYMSKTQTSALPPETSKLQRQTARLVHLGMYASLASIAITGLAIAGLFAIGFKSGLIIDLVIELHGVVVTASYWLIAIHIIAAIYHRFLGDGVWTAMVPFWKESLNDKR